MRVAQVRASMATPLPTMWHAQALTLIGLVGIFIGWRGGMRRMVGFYDMPNATIHLAWGIAIGGLSAWFVDSLFIQPMLAVRAVPVESVVLLLFIGLAQTGAVHLLLTRERVKLLRAAPTSGWTFGLGLGGMQVVYLLIRVADENWIGIIAGFGTPTILLGVYLAVFAPWLQGIIGAWQGAGILSGRPWGAIWKAALARGLLLFLLAYGVLNLPMLLMLVPAVLLGQMRADDEWLPLALLPSLRQEYERVRRKGGKRLKQRRERERGVPVAEEE